MQTAEDIRVHVMTDLGKYQSYWLKNDRSFVQNYLELPNHFSPPKIPPAFPLERLNISCEWIPEER